jgi:glycosyltransferase involved in cell wall biosynthesis
VVGLADSGGVHWEQFAAPRALRKGDFSLFHAPAEHGVPFVSAVPTVLTIHSVTVHSYIELVAGGMLPGKASDYLGPAADLRRWTWANLYWRLQIRRASHILTPSRYAKAEVHRFLRIPDALVDVTPLAVDDQFTRPAKSSAEISNTLKRLGIRSPYLLFVGGYEPHKNVRGLLDTFVAIRAWRPDLALVLVGTKGVPVEVAEKVRKCGLRPGADVHMLADLTDDLADLYDGAELFVTLSWRETFCLPALEAMTRGVPVVASRWGATPEVVGDGGRLVDPRKSKEAADAIVEILSSPACREKWVSKALTAARRFSWQDTASKTLTVYQSLVSGGA